VFGSEVAGDLSRLKDKLPPFSMKQARAALAAEFGEAEAVRLFPGLSEPVAAASLAQVHKMPLPDGDRAVKILRPGIERQMELELSAMRRAARTIEGVSSESRRLKPIALTDTISNFMLRELDLRLEAGGADEMRAINEKTGFFDIPKVDWERTGKRVLTISWINGTPLTQPGVLDRPGLDRVKARQRHHAGLPRQRHRVRRLPCRHA
jgi:ubiquinone biosynthesis protein